MRFVIVPTLEEQQQLDPVVIKGMSASLINRSLTTVRTELEFLRESNVISEETFKMVRDSIPEKYNPNESKDSVASGSELVEALYRFDPQQDGDLALSPGDKVEVLEKPSNEWFKGRCNGRVGMFPANYVKPAFSGSEASRPNVPPPPQYEQQQEVQRMNTQQSGGSYQQPYPPASTGYYQQQQPQQQQQQQQPQEQQQQQQHHSSGHLRKFGSKLGNAAIFGAGATMGSDLVNSIF